MAKAKETQESMRSDESRQHDSALAQQPRSGELSRDFGGFRYASPFSFMKRFSEEMDRLFEDVGFGGSYLGRPFSQQGDLNSFAWSPQIETFQRDNQFVFRADLPGMNKDDLKVSVDDNCLAIQGERKREWTSDQESSGGTAVSVVMEASIVVFRCRRAFRPKTFRPHFEMESSR